MRAAILTILFTFITLSSLDAKEQVVVVVGQGAPDLEHIAAQELVSQFKRLFDANVVLTDFAPDEHKNLVLVGSPRKNKAVRAIAGDNWPKLSNQGFILRSFDAEDQSGIIVAGDSPVATLWAVYELGHRFGIRYLLREDIFPDKQPLKLSGFDELLEPDVKVRAWKTLGGGVTGPESWPANEQKKLFAQLAKMKFNQVILSVKSSQPFVDYEFGGIQKKTATLWNGEQFPIPRDAPGRTAFGDATAFENYDFANTKTYEQTIDAGVRHVRKVIAAAKRLGMSVALEIAPFDVPAEVDSTSPEFTKARISAFLETYPEIEKVYLSTKQNDQQQKQLGELYSQLKSDESIANRLSELSVDASGKLSVLSESFGQSLYEQVAANDNTPTGSFALGNSMLAELDNTAHCLSRAAWDTDAEVRAIQDSLFTQITGDQAISDRLWLGFNHMESAAKLIKENDTGIAQPSQNMLMQHYKNEAAPDWWEPLTEHYTQAMIELYRSRGPAHPRSRPLLYYYAKRSEYVLEYLACVKAVRAAAVAKADGDTDAAIEQLETAIESLYNAIDTLGDVAQDSSDRGLIATLNAYAYRPLMTEYERVLESE